MEEIIHFQIIFNIVFILFYWWKLDSLINYCSIKKYFSDSFSMQNKEFYTWFNRYQQDALKMNERRLIVLVGTSGWARDLLTSIQVINLQNVEKETKRSLIYGDSKTITANVSKQRFRDKLGSECHYVVFQDYDLSIDALAGLSGTLLAGGIFFLLIQDLAQIEHSVFYQRFFQHIKAFSQHVVIKENQPNYPNIAVDSLSEVIETPNKQLTYNCLTQEQVLAVNAVKKVFQGKRNQPLVLTADRGRGKSSALAIACAQLLTSSAKDNVLKIVITAIDVGSLSVFFTQLKASLPNGQETKGSYTYSHGSVEFVPIDQLLKQEIKASLVLIDEAAAIPVYLLEALLPRYSRLVFSSTVHGYEGAGRGFAIKFQKTLSLQFAKWRSLHIKQPIRWRVNDPLEALIFDTCLLNAELPILPAGVKSRQTSSLIFKHFSSVELVQDNSLLMQVFSVLVTAHYQTKPSDLRMLLDNENIQLVCLLSINGQQLEDKKDRHIVAVALLISEGSGTSETIEANEVIAISAGQKRLKNQFIPQSLLTQCGIAQAFSFQYMRVMRIAVHPQLQQQGIGSYFLGKIAAFSKVQGSDFLASSFGATSSLLSFWLNNEFQLARIGFTRDKASSEQSAMVLKNLTTKGKQLLNVVNDEFYRSFDYLLTEQYKHLSAEMILVIYQNCPQKRCVDLSERDIANIKGFAQGYRQYSSCVFSLHLWLKHQLINLNYADALNLLVLITRIMQKHSIVDVCDKYGFTGKKDLEKYLRAQVSTFMSNYC